MKVKKALFFSWLLICFIVVLANKPAIAIGFAIFGILFYLSKDES